MCRVVLPPCAAPLPWRPPGRIAVAMAVAGAWHGAWSRGRAALSADVMCKSVNCVEFTTPLAAQAARCGCGVCAMTDVYCSV